MAAEHPNVEKTPEEQRLGLPRQADPELALSTGRATSTQIVFTALAAAAVIGLVFYGLNNSRDETQQSAGAPAETTAAAPAEPASQQNPQAGANPGGAQNAPAPVGQPGANQPAAADSTRGPDSGTTGAGGTDVPAAPAEAPAPQN